MATRKSYEKPKGAKPLTKKDREIALPPPRGGGPRTRGPTPADEDTKDGDRFLASGKVADALAAFDDALALDPKHMGALYGAGSALEQLNATAPAEANVRRVLALADRILERTPPYALSAKVEEHRVPREAIAFAYGVKAKYGVERSKGPKDLERALAQIDKALSFAREADVAGYQATKDRILAALGR
jgi:tetratricopeptide (TPR) repeat protein